MIAKRFLYFSLFFFITALASGEAEASRPFRLLTTEAAVQPESVAVIGLQELGFQFAHVLIDTNPIIDAGYTANIGFKFVWLASNRFSLAIGGRYFNFFGSSKLESYIKQQDSRIDSFSLGFRGELGYLAASYKTDFADYHLNVQGANISESKVFSLLVATNIYLSDNWSVVIEGGYDFTNTIPRASLGIERSGPTFGLRAGATYIRIQDPLIQYNGVGPIIDFYWLFGGPV